MLSLSEHGSRPLIAVILDENTSGDASRYEASKTCFAAIDQAGGVPLGIPYLPALVDPVIKGFDGLLSTGSRFAFPADWYAEGQASRAPDSERSGFERALMAGFLARDKPVLGLCGGMQMLAGLHGCKLTADIGAIPATIFAHDDPATRHAVAVTAGTRLRDIVGVDRFEVNSLHREAVIAAADGVTVAAIALDRVIEAIELPNRAFAIGLQWHQERYAGSEHPGNAVFQAFVAACC